MRAKESKPEQPQQSNDAPDTEYKSSSGIADDEEIKVSNTRPSSVSA
jgi:hypothetical protein